MISLATNVSSYARKIKCPRHYLLKPGHQGYFMERIPALRNIKEADAKALAKYNPTFKLRLWQAKKDRYGNKIKNPADYYQPEVSAAFLKETVYDYINPICQKCRRCQTK